MLVQSLDAQLAQSKKDQEKLGRGKENSEVFRGIFRGFYWDVLTGLYGIFIRGFKGMFIVFFYWDLAMNYWDLNRKSI